LSLATGGVVSVAPHLHVLFLHGAYRELDATTVGFAELPRGSTREVGEALERAVARIVKQLRRRGLLPATGGEAGEDDGLASLAASAASGQSPPAGP
jgi:hypothetical protein